MKKSFGLLLFAFAFPVAGAEPVLRNSGFDKKLAPWTCAEAKVVPDPDKKDNTLLEITLDGGVFGLSQDFKWPADKKQLTLSFRVKASQASTDSPVQWRLRISDAQKSSALVTGGKIEKAGEWITVKKVVEKPGLTATTLMLESNRGEGTLWIDDLKLE